MRNSGLWALALALGLHATAMGWIWRSNGWSSPSVSKNTRAVLQVALLPERREPQTTAASLSSIQDDFLPVPDVQKTPPAENAGTAGNSSFPLNYYPARELDEMPSALSLFKLPTPLPTASGVKGRISIRIWLNEAGEVDRVATVESDLPRPIDELAMAAFRNMRFKAGRINGVRVKSWVDIVFEYDDSQPWPTD